MDKMLNADQMVRLRGFIKGLVHDRTAWIILGSMLYFLGWDSIWFVFIILFTPSAGLYFTCYSLINLIMTIGVIPLAIYGIYKLKSPINRILWYSVWIITFVFFIPGLIWIPYSRFYTYLLSFFMYPPLRYYQTYFHTWRISSFFGLFISIFFHIINTIVIIVPFGLMIRPPELRRGLHLVSAIVLSIWGIADGIGLFYIFQALGITYLKLEVDSATEAQWGLLLILAGIVVWLVAEILKWRSQKPEDAVSTNISE